MNIINDTSSQTVITALPTITGVYDPFITSNELYTGFYTKTQTNTLLNAKENVLTFNAPLTRNTNTIGIDLSSYLTTSAASSTYQPILSFSAPMTKTGNNVTIDLSSYATTASLNNYMTSNATSNIFLTIANAASTYATISSLTPYMTSNATSNIFLTQASAAATYATITNLNLKENALTFSSPLTRTTNAIGIDLSAYSTTTTNNSTYLRLDGSSSMTSKLLLLTGGNGNPSFATNNGGTGDRIVFQSGVAGSILPYSIGYSLNNFWMSAPSGATINTYIDGSIRWSVGSTGAILYGNLNASNILEGNTNLSSKYALSSSLANYVLKAGDTMSGALTVNNNINITSSGTNKLIFDNAFNNKKIEINSNCGLGGGNTDFTFYSAGTFTFRDTTLSTTLFSIDNSGSLSFNGRLYPGKGLYTDNVLTSTSNIISSNFIEGGVSLSSKYITSASLDTTYLRLNGANDMSGKLTVLNGNGLNTPQIGDYGGTGDRIILSKGGGGYPYSFGMNSGTMWYSVPTGAIHNFYVNGTSRYQINSTGASVTGTLKVRATTPAMIRVETDFDAPGQISGIEFGIPAFISANSAKITSTAIAGNKADLQFLTTNGGASSTRMIINEIGNVGMGTNASSASLSLYSTTQLLPRLILSGQEFYVPFNGTLQNSSTEGIAFLSGVNRAGNRQLWIGDSANLTQNTTNSVLRLTNLGYIDCIATDGLTRKPLSIGGNLNLGANGVNIGMNTTSYKSTRTILTASGGSFGYNEPLVQITQTNGWDGNYALQVKGYANIGGDGSGTGLRINGEDTGNTIFQNGNNNMGLTVNNANMYFNTNGATRMTINNSGNVGIGTAIPRARLDVYDNAMIVRGTNEGAVSGVYICNPYLPDSALKTAIIAQGVSSWSRSKLHLCVNTLADNTTSVTAADAKLTIDINGNVGIGQTSAAYPLVVSGTSGSYTITSMSKRYDEVGPISNSTPYTMTGIVAYLNGNVLTPGFYVSFSDERLKKEIEDLSNDFALQTIMKLKPIKYNLIDNICNNNINYGFSAQEVQKVLPEAVITAKHYLPNIYQNVDKVDNNNSNIMIDAKIIGSNLNINDNIKIITHSNEEQIKKIVSINSNVITLDSKIDNYKEEDPLFLYGKEEEDIRCVNHNFLYNVNIKATQVLYEIIMKQQEEIIKLTNVLITSNIISPL